MRKSDAERVFQDLEQDLANLHRPLPLDPGFVIGVEEKILNRAAELSRQAKLKSPSRQDGWISRIFSTSRALAWGVLAVLLVAGLGWSIRHFLPDQDRAGGAVRTETAKPTVIASPTPSPSPAPVSTHIPAGLNLDSSHDEIRQLIINPTWKTLWIQGQAKLISPTGIEQNFYVQAWLDRNGAGRVLSTDQLPGSLNFNLDMVPRWVWISDSETLSMFDVQTGQFDLSTANQRWSVHPLETAGQTMGMLFPTYLAVRSEDLQVIEMNEQAGRPVLVVDWAYFRLWVDAQTGVLLRQQTRDENGQVSQDILLTAIAYDLPLPEDVLLIENLDQSRFESPPDREILPDLPVLDPDSHVSSEAGEIYFELSGEPPFQWRMAVLPAGCLVSGLPCPDPQEIPERPRPQLFLNWSHNGRRAVFADTNFNQLWSFDPDTKSWKVVLESGFQMQLAWSQDDRWLAAVPLESDPNHMNLVWIDTEHWSIHHIPTSLKGNKEIIAWLDEHTLAVTVLPDSFKGGEPEWIAEFQPGLFRVDIETGEFELVQPLSGELSVFPDPLSPDGRYFLVGKEDQGRPSLALASLDFQEISTLNVIGDSAQWSPDGEWISFIDIGQNFSLVRLDGSQVKTSLSQVLSVAWSPDSQHLLVQTGNADANDRLWLVSTWGEVREVEILGLKESYTWFLLGWQRPQYPAISAEQVETRVVDATFAQVYEALTIGSANEYKPLQEVTALDVSKFTERLKDSDYPCVETPAKFWPVR